MASLTQITKRRRRRKRAAVGRSKKRARTKAGTPKFPIHLEERGVSRPVEPALPAHRCGGV